MGEMSDSENHVGRRNDADATTNNITTAANPGPGCARNSLRSAEASLVSHLVLRDRR